MKTPVKRVYSSATRGAAAEHTRSRVLDAGRFLFSRHGIDATTIAQIAERAGVSAATVYATVKSKSGLLEALMHEALFGPRFQMAQEKLAGISDAVERVGVTAHVARAIYEGESKDLSTLLKAAAFTPELRKAQSSFETLRRDMQRSRIDGLFEAKREKPGLDKETAATIMWVLTSREMYHKLVHESGWTADKYQAWLQETLLAGLTDSA